MPSRAPSPPEAARSQTDTSLSEERSKTDKELAERTARAEKHSDAVIDRARVKADQVLETARTQADELLGSDGGPGTGRAALKESRQQEDAVVQEDRHVADEQLEAERAERSNALRELLLRERESTNERLLLERLRSDEALFSRDDFLAMVTHDLRGMLGGIALHAKLLVAHGEALNDPTTAKRARGIQSFTAQMTHLVGDLVDVASIEAGQLRLARSIDDACALLEECHEAMIAATEAAGLTLELSLPNEPQIANFDRERIHQVLANLGTNAIKFTPRGGKVTLRLERTDDMLRFSVTDTGPGIEAARQPSVFERFWQGDTQDKRGFGLGLYISRRIVEDHGGEMGVTSVLGRGSIFFFTLPLTRS